MSSMFLQDYHLFVDNFYISLSCFLPSSVLVQLSLNCLFVNSFGSVREPSSVKSFVILSVNTYNHSLCACGMIVYSNVDVTSYGRTGYNWCCCFFSLLCLCRMFICSCTNNFYSSPQFFIYLLEKGCAATGIVRTKRRGFPKGFDNRMEKTASRGTIRWFRSVNISFVKWCDTNVCAMATFIQQLIQIRLRRRKKWMGSFRK